MKAVGLRKKRGGCGGNALLPWRHPPPTLLFETRTHNTRWQTSSSSSVCMNSQLKRPWPVRHRVTSVWQTQAIVRSGRSTSQSRHARRRGLNTSAGSLNPPVSSHLSANCNAGRPRSMVAFVPFDKAHGICWNSTLTETARETGNTDKTQTGRKRHHKQTLQTSQTSQTSQISQTERQTTHLSRQAPQSSPSSPSGAPVYHQTCGKPDTSNQRPNLASNASGGDPRSSLPEVRSRPSTHTSVGKAPASSWSCAPVESAKKGGRGCERVGAVRGDLDIDLGATPAHPPGMFPP